MSRLGSLWIGLLLAVAGAVAALWSACQGNDNAWYLGFPAIWAASVAWAVSVRTAPRALVAWGSALAANVELIHVTFRCSTLAAGYGTGAPAIRALFGNADRGRDEFLPIVAFGSETHVDISVDWLTAALLPVALFATVPLLRAASPKSRLAGSASAALPFLWQLVVAVNAGTEAYALSALVPAAWLATFLRGRSPAPIVVRDPTFRPRRRPSGAALAGLCLVALTAVGWVWFAVRPYDHGLDTGTLPLAAAAVAWVSGAPTWPRAVVRAAQAVLVLAAFWTCLGWLLFQGALPQYGFSGLRWWEAVLPPVAIVLGWLARGLVSARARRACVALLVIPSLGYAIWPVGEGMAVRGVFAALAASWLAAVLTSARPLRPSGPPRRLASAIGVLTVLLGAVCLADLSLPAITELHTPVREFSFYT